VGTDLTVGLQASLKYRLGKSEAFKQTGWYNVDSRGRVYLPCFGYEFEFLFRTTSYQWVRIDYLKINGKVHTQ
jgi:hypothetical protein